MWRRKRDEEETRPALRPGNEFGWRAHQAIQSWTASVDVKASIVVVVETAVAGAAAKALITEKGELHSAVGLHLATAICAMSALVLAVGCALWVVFPRLKRSRTATLAPSDLIYFGHTRARVAWRKHAWLQASLGLFSVGAALLVLAFVAF